MIQPPAKITRQRERPTEKDEEDVFLRTGRGSGRQEWSPWVPRGEQHALSHDECPRSKASGRRAVSGTHLVPIGTKC